MEFDQPAPVEAPAPVTAPAPQAEPAAAPQAAAPGPSESPEQASNGFLASIWAPIKQLFSSDAPPEAPVDKTFRPDSVSGEASADQAKAAYDSTRASDGDGGTSETKTHVDGHVDASGAGANASYDTKSATDDGQGDKTSTQTSVAGKVAVDADGNVTGGASGSRTSADETKNAETGGGTTSSTTLKGDVSVDKDGGKGSASASSAQSEDHGDGSKNASTTTVSGGVQVKDGKVSGDGAVSSERTSSVEDKDSGEKASKSDKVGVDVHVEDGKTQAGASYDRARSSADGEGGTRETKTSVAGHVGEQGSGGTVSYDGKTGTDDGQGDKTSVQTKVDGKLDVDAKGNASGAASASRTSADETKDAETGGGTTSSTTVKGDVAFDKDGGKGSASASSAQSEDHGDGSKNASSTTVSGGVQSKDGKVSGDGAVSSERTSSVEDKDSGEKASKSDKVDVGVHVGDGTTSADASYDRKRATEDGATKTSDATTVKGHLGEKDASGSVSASSSVETKDEAGRTTKTDTTTSGGVTVDDKGTTVDAGRKTSTSDGDGNGASETSSSDVKGKVNVDKNGDVSADASGKTGHDWDYKDKDGPLATNRGASADGSVHIDKDKASVQGGAEAHRSATDEDGASAGQSGKVSAGATTNSKGETTYNADGTVKSSEGYANKDAGVAGSLEKSATASVASGPDKTEVKGDIAAKKTMGMDGAGSAEDSAHAGGGVTVDKDGKTIVTVQGGVESKQTLNTDDGTQSKSSKLDGSFSNGSDGSFKAGASMGKTQEETHKDADGKETKTGSSTTVGGTFGQDADGTMHVGVNGGVKNTTTNADGTTSSKGIDGGVELTKGEGKEGIAGKVGVTQDGNHVAVSGGYQTTFGKPTQNADGTWNVPYNTTASAGAEAGAGKDTTASASASGSTSTFGARSFKDEAEAKAFFDKGEVPDTKVPTTAADAKDLPPGTTVGVATSGKVGGSAGVSGGGIGVNAGGEVHGGSSVAVTAKGNGMVEVEAGQSDGKSGQVGLSGGPASMGVGSGTDHATSTKVQFDLNSPAGQAAYEQYLKDPSKVPAEGATVTSKTETTKETDSANGGMGVQVGEKGTYEKKVTTDKDGKVVETDQKGSQAATVAVPFVGKYSRETSLDIDHKANGDVTYTGRTDIDDTKASDANHDLAKATNSTEDRNVDGKSSGKWHVDTVYDKSTMETFAKQVETGEYNKPLGTVGTGARDQLKADLAAAGADPIKREEALAKFTKSGGPDALSQVKDATGKDGEHYLQLDGDKYLTGAQGRKDLDGQIADVQNRVAGGQADVGEVRDLLAQQKERMRMLADPANYPDMPADVRAKEVARSKADIDKLQPSLEQAKDDRRVLGDQPDAPSAAQQDRADAGAQSMDDARAAEQAAYEAARHERKVHDGYYGQSSLNARQQFGDKDFGVFDNSETKSYAQADKAYADAQAALKEAEKHERVYDRAGDDNGSSATAAADAAQRAAEAHQKAAEKFAEAQRQYDAIRERHKADAKGGTFDGENHKLRPGE